VIAREEIHVFTGLPCAMTGRLSHISLNEVERKPKSAFPLSMQLASSNARRSPGPARSTAHCLQTDF
jgi:hypothetical protein